MKKLVLKKSTVSVLGSKNLVSIRGGMDQGDSAVIIRVKKRPDLD